MEHQDQIYRLYITGDSPNSRRARTTLRHLFEIEGRLADDRLEIVDVLEQPRRAAEDGVTVTPALFALRPTARMLIFGDMSDRARVMAVLGLMDEGLDS